jgi:hypothetical protein
MRSNENGELVNPKRSIRCQNRQLLVGIVRSQIGKSIRRIDDGDEPSSPFGGRII